MTCIGSLPIEFLMSPAYEITPHTTVILNLKLMKPLQNFPDRPIISPKTSKCVVLYIYKISQSVHSFKFIFTTKLFRVYKQFLFLNKHWILQTHILRKNYMKEGKTNISYLENKKNVKMNLKFIKFMVWALVGFSWTVTTL